ncbi:hypothetical protein ASPCAL14131 [Aspergillus calidoustus]|uniref:Uncharacterized protein n=1 Tax=Aspergillus calidoustus TaxID=454130 RepID=A0A0U5GH46_ASPCI|nr:hypothetical protein ASPCAL14131 [Aspergillus calidoustus]
MRERVGSIAGCLQKNVRKRKKDGAENKGAAIRLSGEAARIAGKEGAAGAVSAATAAAHANRIVTDAAKVAEEAANVPTQGDSDEGSHNIRVVAEISEKTTVLEDGVATVAEEVDTQFEEPLHKIDGDIQQIKKEAASIAAESAAGLLAKLASDDIVNRILAEVFKLLVDPNVALKTAGDFFESAADQAVRDFIFGVTARCLCALRGSLGSIPPLYEDIFKDGPNSDALRYIVKERSQIVVEFLHRPH